MNSPYYHGILRKFHIAFGSIFNNLILTRNERLTNDGDETQRFVVPIEYANRDLWLARLRQDPTLSRKEKIVLPRMAYEMTGLSYDANRKLNSLNQRLQGQYNSGDKTSRKYFVGVPYILHFKLYAITRSTEDANQIVEQIVPFFTPDYSLLVKLIPSLNILDRMRLVLESGSPEWSDTYESVSNESTREIVLTFSFTAQSTLYGPVAATPANIIRKVIVDLYDAPYDTTLTGPVYSITESLDRLVLEDETGRLIDESTTSDLRTIARVARIEVEPDPLDAPPIKPVDTTTTITEFVDGKAVNPFSGDDVDIDVS